MAFTKLVNLFALSSLAVLLCSTGVQPVTALSVDREVSFARRTHGHDSLAKRRRAVGRRSSGRCKARSPSESPAPESNSDVTSSASSPSSTPADNSDKPSNNSSDTPPAEDNNNNNNGGNDSGKNNSDNGGETTTSKPTPTPAPSGNSNGKKVGLAYTGGGDLASFVTKNTH